MLRPPKNSLAAFQARRPAEARRLLCHAPFKSMFFNVRGRLNVCCYNKHHVLGTWPDQSIREMWFGEQAQAIRDAIRDEDLSKGCNYCFHLFEAGNFSSLPVKNFDDLAWNEQGYPSKIDFELSNICNLECTMCKGELSSSIRKNRDGKPPMPQLYGEEFLRQIREFLPHAEHIHFLGGEPFLIPVYFELWALIRELNPRAHISIQTNATVLNQRVKQLLEEMPASLAVSLDSFRKESYEAIRLNAKFERVMENLHWFLEYCDRKGTFLSISFCPMVENWAELPEVVLRCNELEADVFFNTVYHPYSSSLSRLSAAELGRIVDELEGAVLPRGSARERANALRFADVLRQLRNWRDQASRREEIFRGHGGIASLDEFFGRLSRFIELDEELSGQEGLFEDMQDKINEVALRARSAGHFDALWEQILTTPMEQMCREIPLFSAEKLFGMFLETVE